MTFLLETTEVTHNTRVWSCCQTSVRRLARSCRDVISSPRTLPLRLLVLLPILCDLAPLRLCVKKTFNAKAPRRKGAKEDEEFGSMFEATR